MVSKFIDFLERATCPHTTVATIKEKLLAEGFNELKINEEWSLNTGGKYLIDVFGSSVIAFDIGKKFGYYGRVNIAAAHSDSPGLVIKPNPHIKQGRYMKINVECYGGAILNTWLDRPLGMAGVVVCRGADSFSPVMRIFDSKRPVFVIPNLAIHFNRDVNKGVELNKQKDMIPLAGIVEENMSKDDYLYNYLADELGIVAEDILDFQLYVYNCEKGCLTGINKDMVLAPRIDNLASAYICMNRMLNCKNNRNFNVIAVFDNEEVGSKTKQGAASDILYHILKKAFGAIGRDEDNLNGRINEGLFLSLDGAHATHPNHGDKYDPTNQIYLNDGLIIKKAANQAYGTDSVSAAIVKDLCQKNTISYKEFVNKSDMPGGSTLGAIASTKLPMRMVDLGIPMLAMHSSMELMGTEDIVALDKLVEIVFNS